MAQYTDFLGITKLEPGQQQAHVVANEAFDNYDLAVAGMVEVDLAGKSEYSMSGRDSTHAVLRFLNADRDCLVTVQARPKTWTVINDSARAIEVRTDYPNSVPLALGAGLVVKVICDGTNMRAASDGLSQLAAHDQSATAHNALTAARTYYIRSGGSDHNDGLTKASPLATVAAAKARLRRLKTNGYAVTLDIGEGSWPAILFMEGEAGDAAAVIINGAGSGLTTIAGASDYAVRLYNNSAFFTLQNFGFTSAGQGVDVFNVKRLDLNNLRFGTCGLNQLNLQVTQCLVGRGVSIIGGAASAFNCVHYTYFRCNQPITLANTPHFSSAFTYCSGNALGYWAGTTFSGEATGIRYRAAWSGQIRVDGGGANFLPGNEAGIVSTATGGSYA